MSGTLYKLPTSHKSSSAVPQFSCPLPSTESLTMFRPIVLTISALLLLPFTHAAVIDARDSTVQFCGWICPWNDLNGNTQFTSFTPGDKITECSYGEDPTCTYSTVR